MIKIDRNYIGGDTKQSRNILEQVHKLNADTNTTSIETWNTIHACVRGYSSSSLTCMIC